MDLGNLGLHSVSDRSGNGEIGKSQVLKALVIVIILKPGVVVERLGQRLTTVSPLEKSPGEESETVFTVRDMMKEFLFQK